MLLEATGIKLLSKELEGAMANVNSNDPDTNREVFASNYPLLVTILKIMFVLAFKDRAKEQLKSENLFDTLSRINKKALEEREGRLILATLRLFSFFTDEVLDIE